MPKNEESPDSVPALQSGELRRHTKVERSRPVSTRLPSRATRQSLDQISRDRTLDLR